MINKTGKVQFRVYAVVEDQRIELATTQPPEGADTAAKTPEGPTVTAEDLNLSGEGGPKRFFSDDEKPDDKKPPKKK
jgi:hypothetical protein